MQLPTDVQEESRVGAALADVIAPVAQSRTGQRAVLISASELSQINQANEMRSTQVSGMESGLRILIKILSKQVLLTR